MEVIKKYSLILLCLLFYNCTAKKQLQGLEDSSVSDSKILGKYIKDNSPYMTPNVEEIELSANSLVKYKLNMEFLGNQIFEGSWELEKDTLNLFFNIPPEKINGKLEVLFDDIKQDSISLTLIDNHNISLEGYTLILNNEKYDLIFSNNIKIKPQFIDSIEIDTHIGRYKKEINKYIDSNLKIVLTPDEFRNAIYEFLKTKWLVKGNNLILIKNDSVIKKYFLKKENY